jgi:Protein of unknown function (DUF2752)
MSVYTLPMRLLQCKVDRRLAPHLLVLAGIAASTLLLASCPQAILHAGYRCELQTLLGIRCPFCGMTRDFAAILHGGRPTLNPCSWFAACAVYLLYPAGVVVAWKGNRLDVFYSRFARSAVALVLAVMLVANNWR